MEVQDDRTAEQKLSHTKIILGYDKCLSGWGKAENGKSYCAWACKPEYEETVLRWVENRKDLKNVRLVNSKYKPRGEGHYHIYVVHDNHPSIN
jgi:hypothetical protein